MGRINHDWLADFDWAAETQDCHSVRQILQEMLEWCGFKEADPKPPSTKVDKDEMRTFWRDLVGTDKPALMTHLQTCSDDDLKAFAFEFYAVIESTVRGEKSETTDMRKVALQKLETIRRVCEHYMTDGGMPKRVSATGAEIIKFKRP